MFAFSSELLSAAGDFSSLSLVSLSEELGSSSNGFSLVDSRTSVARLYWLKDLEQVLQQSRRSKSFLMPCLNAIMLSLLVI